jgi:general secretion pathway protein E
MSLSSEFGIIALITTSVQEVKTVEPVDFPAPGMALPESAERNDMLQSALVEQGAISRSKLDRARAIADQTGETLASVLVKLGLCSDERIAQAWASLFGIRFVEAAAFPRARQLPEGLRLAYLKDKLVLPLEDGPDGLVLAMSDPSDLETVNAVAYRTGRRVVRAVALTRDILAWLGSGDGAPSIENRPAGAAFDGDLERLTDLARGAPVVRWVDRLFSLAVEMGASDIHIESQRAGLRVRFRIDGNLSEIDSPMDGAPEAAISRIKVLAKLNIAERRLAQDGRIRINIQGRDIDLRVATMPSLHGETLVLRVLDQTAGHLDLSDLGLSEHAMASLRDGIGRPHGITLVTGPTGSGKTTTLYACLRSLMSPARKFISVEDPVEYEIEGVAQIPVRTEIGFSFAQALRSVLRHDPNVLMIGEIRDAASAQIAVEASLTGHTVLSTIHANSAPSTISRLIEMGVSDYLLATTVNAISAQRLVRVLCPACVEEACVPAALEDRVMPHLVAGTRPDWRRARGCPSCRGTGYRGRKSVAEVMTITEEARACIMSSRSEDVLKKVAVENGMVPLLSEGLRLAASGQTSIEEVMARIGGGGL